MINIKYNIKPFSAELKALGSDLQRKVVRAGVAAAAQVFKKRAKAGAPMLTGRLKRAIFAARSRYRAPGMEHYYVAVSSGKGQDKSTDAFYWRWVEKGHLATGTRKLKGGTRRRALQRSRWAGKVVPAQPFMAPAFSGGQREALAAFEKRMTDRILKANRK